jgi:hypothetical protein
VPFNIEKLGAAYPHISTLTSVKDQQTTSVDAPIVPTPGSKSTAIIPRCLSSIWMSEWPSIEKLGAAYPHISTLTSVKDQQIASVDVLR